MSPFFKEIFVEGYEKVIEVTDPSVGLHGFIVLHNTKLGPALGGIRAHFYDSQEDALTDVLRLSRGMTYKSAVAGTGTGGGKSVIILKQDSPKTEELLAAFGEAINYFNGEYIGAEDVGISPYDLAHVRKKTRYLVGLPHPMSSGDPSRFTAFGGFRGIQAVSQALWHTDSLENRVVAIQGLGCVGSKLADYLFWAGAKLIVADVNEQRCNEIAGLYGAKIVAPTEILFSECDILAPCALGGILNSQSIPKLKCQAVAGLANNQLLEESDGELLMQRDILYAPDYVINAGGLINVSCELNEGEYNPQDARDKTAQLYDQLLVIFKIALDQKRPTYLVANKLAESKLESLENKRETQVFFHH